MASVLSGIAIDGHFLTLRLVFFIWDKLVTRPPLSLFSTSYMLFYMLEWLLM